MAKLQPVQPSMFEEVHRELLQLLDRRRPQEEWRRIFEYGWEHSENYVGYVLVEDGELVGFLGMIFSELRGAGGTEHLCNVSSWIAKESHRAESSALVLPLRDLKAYTVTNLSCNDVAHRIFSRLGFEVLETHTTILTPVRRPSSHSGLRITSDPEQVGSMLQGIDSVIFRDHLPYTQHLLAWDDEGYCYLVYTMGRRRKLRTARIHYCSDKGRLVRDLFPIQMHLMRSHGAMIAECDSRLVEDIELPSSYKKPMRIPRLFKSSRLKREQVSNLYSEVVLLNLP